MTNKNEKDLKEAKELFVVEYNKVMEQMEARADIHGCEGTIAVYLSAVLSAAKNMGRDNISALFGLLGSWNSDEERSNDDVLIFLALGKKKDTVETANIPFKEQLDEIINRECPCDTPCGE